MAGEYYLTEIIVWSVKFGKEGIMVWGHFSGFSLGPLFPVKGNGNAIAFKDISDTCMLHALWQQFAVDLFLFQHDWAPVCKGSTSARKT